MKNNNRPISDGLKGFPKHTVCMSGYPKKTKAEKTNTARHEISKCTNEGYKLSIKFFIDKEKKHRKELTNYLLSITKFSNWISLLKSSLETKLTIEDIRCLQCFK